MRVRGTQKAVFPIEANADTVYVRSNIVRVSEEEFEGWEYDEITYSINEFIESLALSSDVESMAFLISMMMGEVDFLRSRIEALEGGSAQ